MYIYIYIYISHPECTSVNQSHALTYTTLSMHVIESNTIIYL